MPRGSNQFTPSGANTGQGGLGKVDESFKTMDDVDREITRYQKKVSGMARAHKQMMRETSDLINFASNPKYRGQTITVKEVSMSGKLVATRGQPITGYVNSASVFLPSTEVRPATTDVLDVVFGKAPVSGDAASGQSLFIAKDASTGAPVFMYAAGGGRNIKNLLDVQTAGELSPNVGQNNMDGASSNLFLTEPVNTYESSVDYAGCAGRPGSDGDWTKASGKSNNWSYGACKTLADAQGAKQFALGADSWKLSVVHAGSREVDYSGTYACGLEYSEKPIAYRRVTYQGAQISLRLLMSASMSDYFDAAGQPLPSLERAVPVGGQAAGGIRDCWPTFVHPEKPGCYIAHIVAAGAWLLVEDTGCDASSGAVAAPGKFSSMGACDGNSPSAPAMGDIKATKTGANPLGGWGGAEDVTVLLSMNCWYSTGKEAHVPDANSMVIAGQFDGTNSVLFTIPSDSRGLQVGVDGLLYSSPGHVLGAESMLQDGTLRDNTDSEVISSGGGSNMAGYYGLIGKTQSSKKCSYHPKTQVDGYPDLGAYTAKVDSDALERLREEDDKTMYDHTVYQNFQKAPLGPMDCLTGPGSSCSTIDPGMRCYHQSPQDVVDNANIVKQDAQNVLEGVEDWLTGKPSKPLKMKSPSAHQTLFCYEDYGKPGTDREWRLVGGDGNLDKSKPDPVTKALLDDIPRLGKKPLRCKDPIKNSSGLVADSIAAAIQHEGRAGGYGSFEYVDESDHGRGGTYTVGENVSGVCSGGNVPISGDYMCGDYKNEISSSSAAGETIDLLCPGKEVCRLHLLLSNEGSLMMVAGAYKGPTPAQSNIIWQTSPIPLKAGSPTPNHAWMTASSVWKVGGKRVPYINDNSILPKGSFLLSENGVFRFAYGIALQGDASDNGWNVDFLSRFKILDESLNQDLKQSSGASLSGGEATTCDTCAVIEYSLASCHNIKYTIKFDEDSGRYVVPANKTMHMYSLSGAQAAIYDNPQADNTGIYNTFYVDEYNVPYVLNPDALSYGRANDYLYFGNYSLGELGPPTKLSGIGRITVGDTPTATEKAALDYLRKTECTATLPSCGVRAFNLDIATGDMWVHTDLDPSVELHPAEVSMRPGLRLYMKRPVRKLDSLGEGCSDMVLVGGSKDIVGQAGGPWTDSTLAGQTDLPKKCGSVRDVSGVRGRFDRKYRKGVRAAGREIVGEIAGLEQTQDELGRELSAAKADVDNTTKTYERVHDQVVAMLQDGTVDGQLESSRLKLVEDNYQYIVWSVLAIALVMFAMSIRRK